VKDALNRTGGGTLIGIDRDPECVGSRFVDEFYTSLDGVDYDIIIPTRDGELEEFEAVPNAVVSGSVYRFQDKLVFASLGYVLGLPVPQTGTLPSHVDPPYLSKPRFGAGAQGISIRYTKTGIPEPADEEMVYQPLLEGDEYGVDAYIRADGIVQGAVVRRQDRRMHGECTVATVVDRPDIQYMVWQATQAFPELRGPVHMQFIDGKLIEINPRVSGFINCSVHAGLDVFKWMIEERRGESLSPFVENFIRMVRYKQDMVEGI
jgi:carbamoyl-phosphate synthase large subunit